MFGKKFSGGLWKPKDPHSLEYLKYLYGVLSKNTTITENNRTLLVEVLRSIAEILIWGDQHDTLVFDFFLEKNMLSYFLRIMRQKCGRYVCTQLLQTLNILFENIRSTTSLYYLLSNNHVNSIITHRFDFSDEEILAYYISFLKTLSLKLNNNSIHFFFNEQSNDFPLYTEAIKFFKHPEGMVRIAVRTLTLNVFRVGDTAMLNFIRDKTAAPYFSNLVWFIGNHIAQINTESQADPSICLINQIESDMEEHLDHIHYVNDILCLNIDQLNVVLVSHLLKRLLIPLYLGSLSPHLLAQTTPCVSIVVALFLISQIFLVIEHEPLVDELARILLTGDQSVFYISADFCDEDLSPDFLAAPPHIETADSALSLEKNSTDEQKLQHLVRQNNPDGLTSQNELFPLVNKPFLCSLLNALDCSVTDHAAAFALTVIYALGHNKGVNRQLLVTSGIILNDSNIRSDFNSELLQRLVRIVSSSVDSESPVRIVTLELCCRILSQFFTSTNLPDEFLEEQKERLLSSSKHVLKLVRQFYRTEELFLDLFEDEYRQLEKPVPQVSFLSSSPVLLLPPISSPLTGVEFTKRLPCGPQEKIRKTIRVYFLLRRLLMQLSGQTEFQLPLNNPTECVTVDTCLNLNNSDLLSCTVVTNEVKYSRFLVTDGLQMVLVEPESKRLGYGVVKFVGFLQDMEVLGDRDDSRTLHVTIQLPAAKTKSGCTPQLAAKFVFDDHIRCMAAKQRLMKGRQKARSYKMSLIAQLLDLPVTEPTTSNRLKPVPVPAGSLTQSKRVPGYVTSASSSTDSSAPSRLPASVNAFVNDVVDTANRITGGGGSRKSGDREPITVEPKPLFPPTSPLEKKKKLKERKQQKGKNGNIETNGGGGFFKRRVRVLSIGSLAQEANAIPLEDFSPEPRKTSIFGNREPKAVMSVSYNSPKPGQDADSIDGGHEPSISVISVRRPAGDDRSSHRITYSGAESARPEADGANAQLYASAELRERSQSLSPTYLRKTYTDFLNSQPSSCDGSRPESTRASNESSPRHLPFLPRNIVGSKKSTPVPGRRSTSGHRLNRSNTITVDQQSLSEALRVNIEPITKLVDEIAVEVREDQSPSIDGGGHSGIQCFSNVASARPSKLHKAPIKNM